jgi:serine kinase of HPr protein (carbohydrate metabolism regulator)
VEQVRLEDVFKISGVPTATFVEPTEYNNLKVALRTAGRGVVVEGPSGIGKSTAVTRALDEVAHPRQ